MFKAYFVHKGMYMI